MQNLDLVVVSDYRNRMMPDLPPAWMAFSRRRAESSDRANLDVKLEDISLNLFV